MKAILLSAALSALIALPFMAYAGQTSPGDPVLAQRELAAALAPIQSAADLQAYMRQNAGQSSPFSALSPGAQKRFVRSLVFTDNGLASFDYTDLRIELSASQIYQLLALFGREQSTTSIPHLRVQSEADRLVVEAVQRVRWDYPDRWCSTPHTCSTRVGDICIVPGC